MSNVAVSDSISNTSTIAPTMDYTVPLKLNLLSSYAYDRQFFNHCILMNNSTETIKVLIGNDTEIIKSGDGFEWSADTVPVHFNNMVINNQGVVNTIILSSIIISYSKVI